MQNSFRGDDGPSGVRRFHRGQVLPVDSWINVAVSCDEKSAVLYINGEKIADGVLAQGEKFVPADGIGTLFTIGHYPTPLDAYKHI